jgi:hypothetical protein
MLAFFIDFFKKYKKFVAIKFATLVVTLKIHREEVLKKANIPLKWVKMIFCFWQRLKQSDSFFEIKLYFFLKRKFFRNTFGYYQGLFEYYSDRVYEDDSEHKFNERIWISDLNRMKYTINSYVYRESLQFLQNPFKYIKESAIVIALADNFNFWRQTVPFLFWEVHIIFLEVFYSFYLNHDEEAFYKHFSLEKPQEIKEAAEVPPVYEDFIVDLTAKSVEEKADIPEKQTDEK